jgi:hypothetical protein
VDKYREDEDEDEIKRRQVPDVCFESILRVYEPFSYQKFTPLGFVYTPEQKKDVDLAPAKLLEIEQLIESSQRHNGKFVMDGFPNYHPKKEDRIIVDADALQKIAQNEQKLMAQSYSQKTARDLTYYVKSLVQKVFD